MAPSARCKYKQRRLTQDLLAVLVQGDADGVVLEAGQPQLRRQAQSFLMAAIQRETINRIA